MHKNDLYDSDIDVNPLILSRIEVLSNNPPYPHLKLSAQIIHLNIHDRYMSHETCFISISNNYYKVVRKREFDFKVLEYL